MCLCFILMIVSFTVQCKLLLFSTLSARESSTCTMSLQSTVICYVTLAFGFAGHRACHWGPVCEGVERRLSLGAYNITFCCLGDKQNVHTTHFGGGNVVCRCHGSSVPPDNPHRYVLPQTLNASSSGKNGQKKCLSFL